MREKDMQARVKRWAEKRWAGQLVVIKLTTLGMMGQAGWPDLAFFVGGDTPFAFFVEMKKPRGEVTDLQRHRHDTLRSLGFAVYVCYSVEAAKHSVEAEMERE